jgi:23S rRNA pseudouridine1911/1915/1917 synthase
VWGIPSPRKGTIVGAIGRSPHNRQKMAIVRRGGKEAETSFLTRATFGTVATLIECRLMTGRTHQIRVHMSSRGHPLIGDPVYGGGRKLPKTAPAEVFATVGAFKRQALHAATLGFIHPTTGEELRFERPPPADFAALVTALKKL